MCFKHTVRIEQLVIAGAAGQRILESVAAGQDVIVGTATQNVVAVIAADRVITDSAGDGVVAIFFGDRLGAADLYVREFYFGVLVGIGLFVEKPASSTV